MFDIGFWELALIGVVALLVVGPERLPAFARAAGLWIGRLRRFVSSVKADIEQELRADELKKMLNKSGQLEDIHEIIEETRDTLAETSRELAADAIEPPKAKVNAASGTAKSGAATTKADAEATTVTASTSDSGRQAARATGEVGVTSSQSVENPAKHGDKPLEP